MYGGSKEQIDYRLGLVQHGCNDDHQFSYHADARERPLVWIGRGLEAFGVEGLAAGAELTSEQHEMAHRLIQGQHPVTGEQLVAPKVGVPADAKVQWAPLVAAVHEAAQARGVAPETLFQGASLAKAWDTAARGVAREGGRALGRVDTAARLAEAAGLAPGEVWGAERVADARAALYEPRQARDAAGEPVLDADGTPRIEMVERRERVGIAGYDIGVNLPKSLSLLLAFAPEETAAKVEAVYAQAAEKTLGWTEGRTSYVQRGKHGGGKTARREESSGFSGWVMTHRSARPVGDYPIGDPHWHVHITVANMAKAPDGTWLTIGAGGRELVRHAAAIDKVTQAQIRQELRREFGISFARAENGAWEVEHVPREAVELFSKRHQQVTEVLAALGYSNATASAKEARVLTRACRSGKSETTAAADVTLREYWRAQALAAGYDPAEWMPQVLAGYQAGQAAGTVQATEQGNEMMLARHGVTLDDVVARLTDVDTGLTAHARRFSHLDALTATADALPHGASVAEVEQIAELVLAHPAFVSLPQAGVMVGPGGDRAQLAGSHRMAGGALYTTADVPAAEREILEVVAAAKAAGPGRCLVDAEVLAGAVAGVEADQGYPLSGEQRQVLERLTGAGRAVETLEGPPGCGKTTLMRAARVAWEAAGYRVAGAATQGVTAQGLQGESGIESRTCAQWRVRIENGPGLAGIDKLVIDETSLTDDRDRQVLYREAARTGTEILEVLDPHQLRTPGCGSLGAYIHTQLDGARLTENRRQRSEDERAAIALYREGRHHEALTKWQDLGQVVATRTTEQGVAAMVAEWMRRAEGAPDPHARAGGLLMIAATNEMTDRLNSGVQAVRDLEGQLGEGSTVAVPGGRSVSFHVGDAVLIRRSDRTQQAVAGEAVLNGYQGVVTAVSPTGVSVEWHQPGDADGQAPHTATCSPQYIAAGGLELGYCITGHKAQGKTIGAQWVLPDSVRNDGSVLAWGPGMDRAGLLVALSRAQGETLIYGGLDAVEGDREELLFGKAETQQEVRDRFVGALATRADATYANPNDTPTLVELGEVAEHSAVAGAQPDAEGRVDEAAERAGQEPATVQGQAVDEAPAPDEPATVETGPPLRYWGDDHWRNLNRRLHEAQRDGSDYEVQVAFEERQAYENEVLDPEGRDRSRQESWEQYAGRMLLTDEQRHRSEELSQRRTQAAFDRDPVAREAVKAARNAFLAELGPDRYWRLDREERDRTRAERESRRSGLDRFVAEQEARRRWMERPHSRLTAEKLERAITEAENGQAAHVAAAERLFAELAANEPAVAAGEGPQVRRVEEHLTRMRREAEATAAAHAAAEKLQASWEAETRALAQASAKRAEAEQLPWYRSGRRDELRAEAGQLQARAQQAGVEREGRQLELAELGGSAPQRGGYGYAARRAAEDLRRAEASYEQDRVQAHHVDVTMLGGQRDRFARYNAAAGGWGTRHTELVDEQTHRAEMPADQAATEGLLRLRWINEQNRLDEEQRQRQRQHRSRSWDDGYEYGRDLGAGRDQGHGFGMGL
jgi:conjugative relaxase-like TrwC/TraI family protein